MSIGSGEKQINTDVLVIGGGMAGMFAAIKAKEQGLDVTLADKGTVGKAGATHFAEGDTLFFRPSRGHKLEEWVNIISQRCEYINNREWDEICLTEAEARHDDLVSWGVQYYEEDGKQYIFSGIDGKPTAYEDITMVHRKYAPTISRKVVESGVRVLNRIMFCELLKRDGKVVGAVGFDTASGELYIFQARAIVLATGTSGLKTGSTATQFWTGDGEAMAYLAGAEIVSKEFVSSSPWPLLTDIHRQKQAGKGTGISGEIVDTSYRFPFAIGAGFTAWYSPMLNSEGEPIVNVPWEVHCGRAPLYHDMDSYTQGRTEWLRTYFKRIGTDQADKIGLDVFRGGKIKWPASRVGLYSLLAGPGIWPTNTSCASGVPGLFAAGNCCGTVGSGATYAGMGFGLNHAMVTGNRAGLGAAEYASKSKEIKINEAELTKVKDIVYAPLERKGGFSPAWLTQVLHGFTVPYFIFGVKHAERLQAALTLVEFLNSHLVPKLMAKDAHEWRLAYETRNMVLMAEMMLRASLFRTESRGCHFREDYPRRDDPTWLAWVKLKDEQGEMKLYKESIPKEWWPDLSKPYQERYPTRLPGE